MESSIELLCVEDHNESSRNHETHIDMDGIELQDVEVKAPALPEGKDNHLFVSYSSEDSERVWPVVDALERRFNIKCVYADRDFQPGMDITENIRIGMRRSLKCLLMVSSNFTQSGWCKYEREFAFVQSVESGSNRVIPVKLEECEMPSTLVTLTYIDATQPFCDVPKEVIQAMNTADLDFLDQPMENSAKYDNGFFESIQAKRDPLFICRPARNKFEFDQSYMEKFKRSNIQIPGHILDDAIKVLNRCNAVKYFDFIESPCKWCCWCFMPWLLTIIGLVLVGCIILLSRDRFSNFTTRYQETYNSALISPNMIIAGFIACPIIWVIIAIMVCFRHSQMALNVHKKMWKEMSRRCLDHNTILLYWSSMSSRPTLYVMRYDITKCQDYLYRLIQSKPEKRKENELEGKKAAFEMIERYLSGMHPRMALAFDSLPNAPSKRHSVMKGKACLCQCIEQYI